MRLSVRYDKMGGAFPASMDVFLTWGLVEKQLLGGNADPREEAQNMK